MTTTKLFSYQNGNCAVDIFSDGTKIRTWDGIPRPVFPESMDVKITNRCSLENHCKWCHEGSVKDRDQRSERPEIREAEGQKSEIRSQKSAIEA